jgi:hypothetical protein
MTTDAGARPSLGGDAGGSRSVSTILDSVPGLIYCSLQAVQMFHTKAKIYEKKVAA